MGYFDFCNWGTVFVIPDVRLKPWMFEQADKLLEKMEGCTIVCLGNLSDAWDTERKPEHYEKTFKAALEFDRNHPKMLWCYGEQDVRAMLDDPECGYPSEIRSLVREAMLELKRQAKERLQLVHLVWHTLFSNAGVMESFVKDTCDLDCEDLPLEDQVTKINALPITDYLRDSSPVRANAQAPGTDSLFCEADYTTIWQAVGHTPVKNPEYDFESRTLFLDTFSHCSGESPDGDNRFVALNVLSHIWRYADLAKSPAALEREQALEMLKICQAVAEYDSGVSAHEAGDAILAEFLKGLGYRDIVYAWDDICPKYYG